MKRKNLLIIATFITGMLSFQGLHSLPTGAPSDGRTGSPGDGEKTCATSGCHSGPATSVTGILSSNIPAAGYIPGASYTITATIDGAGKKGLCVSPQKLDGSLVGTLTAGSLNQVVGLKYITHTMPLTASPAVFTFTWVAPAAGTGTVSFYGAFANNRNVVRKTVYEVNENIASGLTENETMSNVSIYPNPLVIGSDLHMGFELKQAGDVKISLLDITGKEVSVLKNEQFGKGKGEETFALPELKNGIYFVRLELDGKVINRKLLIQKY
jgi:hypothetical protein